MRSVSRIGLFVAGLGFGIFAADCAAKAAAFVLSQQPGSADELNIKFTGYTTENPGVPVGNSGGRETTWGVGYITEIDNHTNSDMRIWDGNGANPQNASVDFILYGIADSSFTPGAPGVLLNTGCTVGAGCDGKIHVDFYVLSGTDPVRGTSITPASRTGFSTVNGISNVGSLLMSWVLVPGDINNTGDMVTTLYQAVNADVLPTTGSGHFLADCVNGPGCNLFASNQEQLNGLTNLFGDIRGAFTLQSCAPRRGHPSDCPSGNFPNGFAGLSNDPALAVAVPEPGSLLLLGAGLVMLTAFATRKSRI
jgi:hypothetical protein